jgi:hypothetical protein
MPKGRKKIFLKQKLNLQNLNNAAMLNLDINL